MGTLLKAVAGDGARHLRHDVAHGGVIGTQNRHPVKRHAVQKINERAFEPGKVVAVSFHVVGVDVGHHGHHRQQVQKRSIRLVGLNHDVVALPQPGIGTNAVQAPANDKGGVQPGLGQHAGHQAGGGGLAVGAGNGNPFFEAHQLRQHERAWHHGNAVFTRLDHLGVVGLHRGGGHHGVGALDVTRIMANIRGDAQRTQALEGGAVTQVGA